ncbi:SAM-dependent methyltransferase [Streptomyces sp. ODS28]|uniref:SAM-dependent methyltransferase n=1 Tax=Streptomyces sp. ODS28 TaxID=3136688 RepID=UPI0031EFB5BD
MRPEQGLEEGADVGGEKYPTQAIDVATPSVSRMYDFLLGGVENYQSDRDACAELLEIAPSTQALARNNRDFLVRVVRTLVEEYGVEQFLDHGSGLPTQNNVHQVAQRSNRHCRVVYVDNDPIVLAHGRTSLEENSLTAVIDEDMRNTDRIFDHPEVCRLIRPGRRTAALFVSVLHCLPDTGDGREPAAVVKRVRDRLAPGDFMVICQLVSDDRQVREGVTDLMARATHNTWGRVREPHEVRQYFEGLEILEPGLVDVLDWRPDIPPPPQERRATDWVEWGGLARVRASEM